MGRIKLCRVESSGVVRIRTDSDVTVIDVRCPAVRAAEAESIADEILDLSRREKGGHLRFVVSFAACEEVQTACLNTLVSVQDRLLPLGGRLIVAGLPEVAAALVRRSQLADLLHTARETRQAVQMAKGKHLVFRLLPLPLRA